MISVSRQFKKLMDNDNRNFQVYLDITLRNGVVLNLRNKDIWQGTFKIDDGVTANGQFTIGSCNIGKLTFTLNNIYDEFSSYDFYGASVSLRLGLYLKVDNKEKLEAFRKGEYIVDEPSYDGSTITLECLDRMSLFDVDYSNVNTEYPATLGKIVRDICVYCGITLATQSFPNSDYEVLGRPSDDALSCRQVLASCAQIACCFGRMNTYGRLELKWFAQGVFEDNGNLDGGNFDRGEPQYISGDDANGGDFFDYSNGPNIDGGTFEQLKDFHHIYSISSFSTSTDDVVITGIQVTDEFSETDSDKKETVLIGDEGYVLSIASNKLIQKGMARTVAEYLGACLIGLKFRPMTTQSLGDPTIEAGDSIYVTDRRSNSYGCFVTNLVFNLGGFMTLQCDAETPSKNSSKQYSELTQAIVEVRKEAQKQASSLATIMSQSFGVFKTEEVQEDNSIIYYMHDKPTLAESTNIWKFTAGGFAVSTDGGATWTAGMDSEGNATVNILSAIGINCDWIHAGTLTLGGYNNQNGILAMQDADGNEIGKWDNAGIFTTGNIISDSPNTEYRARIYDGRYYAYDTNGDLCGIFQSWWLKDSAGNIIDYGAGVSAKTGITIASGDAALVTYRNQKTTIMAGNIVDIRANTLRISSPGQGAYTGKTGTATFSDNSWLQFKNGILVGGATASGSTF